MTHRLRKLSRAHDAPIWRMVAERLERARHQTIPLNVGELDRIAHDGETIVVAGKLLADGRLAKKVTVGAFAYSKEARGKIRAAGGTALTLDELVGAHPDGSGVRLLA